MDLPIVKFKFLSKKGDIFVFSKDGKDLFHFTIEMNIDVVKVENLLNKIE